MLKQYYISALLLFYTTFFLGQIKKQPNIKFDTDYFDAVDHWVVLPKEETGNYYLLGYVFLDKQLGFTFILESSLTVDNENKWTLSAPSKEYMVRQQLNKNTPYLALLSANQTIELQLPEKPIILQLTSNDSPKISDLVLKGYFYNSIDKSDRAIPILEKAYAIDPKTKNAAFELSYAYNATQQYEKAIALLNKAITYDIKNFNLYRELGYSLFKTAQFDAAENVYEVGLQQCETESQKREMAIDMAQTFFQLKNQKKFEKWAAILREMK